MYQRISYHFDLPDELIAKTPLKERNASRLLLVDRKKESIQEIPFSELINLLEKGDQLIFNDTKVIPARLFAKKETGGIIELLLIRELEKNRWLSLAKPGRKLKTGQRFIIADDFQGVVIDTLPDGTKILQFDTDDFYSKLTQYGQIPLPTYMEREASTEDTTRYQTLFAKNPGAIAAPTAGLHFDEKSIHSLEKKGIDMETITLHVGWGTFKPITVDDIRQHEMHEEFYSVDAETALKINQQPPMKKQILVGTTTLRALESSFHEGKGVIPGLRSTKLFIYPGYTFHLAKALLTNFHLPESTLFILVSTFAGLELTKRAYQYAIKNKFRFYSYGDCMLII